MGGRKNDKYEKLVNFKLIKMDSLSYDYFALLEDSERGAKLTIGSCYNGKLRDTSYCANLERLSDLFMRIK